MSDQHATLKVRAQSSAKAVAGALAGLIKLHGAADLEAVGARAINQAVKAVAIARSYLQADLVCTPSLVRIAQRSSMPRTAVVLSVYRRR